MAEDINTNQNMNNPDIKNINKDEFTGLNENCEKFKAIFDFINEGIICVDDKTKKIVLANPAFCSLIGYTKDEIINFYLSDIYPKENLHEIIDKIKQMFKHRAHNTYEMPIFSKEKNIINCEMTGVMVNIGNTKYFLAFFHDITKKKQIDEQLKQCALELESKNKMLEQKDSAITELSEQMSKSKNLIINNISKNIDAFIRPTLKKIRLSGASKKYVELLQNYLDELSESFGISVTQHDYKLSPREIEISGMIKSGLSSKQISDLLKISYKTVNKHRRDIRKKLGISNKKVNLTSYLQKL